VARITLDHIAHSYHPDSTDPASYALKPIDHVWRQGRAYALLGPSGCGKTTLLNIISGLVTPSAGRLLFDDRDVTQLRTEERNIAQVFQFPVIYDTMTVFQNLAFPLRNRGLDGVAIKARVAEVAALLDLTRVLHRPARGLTADVKQKISLGRGLVRSDVAAVLFDEPLTVIDPALKWELRSKLKLVHRSLDLLMIYVTHDQIEALTFADEVVVMKDGRILQIASPAELFERPDHTFVGYFIGSPGMNLVEAEVEGSSARVAGRRRRPRRHGPKNRGLRPSSPCPGDARSARHLRHRARGRFDQRRVGLADDQSAAPLRVRRRRAATGGGRVMDKPLNNRAWFLVLPVLAFVLFSALLPMMTVVNYSVQDTMGANSFFWNGDAWFRAVLDSSTEMGARFQGALLRNLSFSFVALAIEVPLGVAVAHCLPRRGWTVGPALVVMALPMLIPWNVVGTIWQIFARADIGLFGATLTRLGLHYNDTQDAVSAWCTIVVIDVWHWTSLVVLLSYAGLRAIPDAYYQAARIDAASRWAIFVNIELPKLRKVLIIAVLLRFMQTFMIYTEPFVVTGGGPGDATTFLSIDLVKIALGQVDLGNAAAMSLIYNLITITLCWIFYTIMTQLERRGAQ
jgi:glycerol transport system permease protein